MDLFGESQNNNNNNNNNNYNSERAREEKEEKERLEEAKKRSLEEYVLHEKLMADDEDKELLLAHSVTHDNIYQYRFKKPLNRKAPELITKSSVAYGVNKIRSQPESITLARENLEEITKNIPFENMYLIYALDETLHSISLKQFATVVLKDDDQASLDGNLHHAISQKMLALNISTYGYASKDQKNRLSPAAPLTYASTILASMVTVTTLSYIPFVNLFSITAAITGFIFQLHPRLVTMRYQNKKNGSTPDDDQDEILNNDAWTLMYQTFFSTTMATALMSTEFHSQIGNVVGMILGAAYAAAVPVWAHAVVALACGLILGTVLFSIAYFSQTEKNPYTTEQLLTVAAAGFVAGALMYPAFVYSTMVPGSSYVSTAFTYAINLFLGAVLHVNIKERLNEPPATKSLVRMSQNSKALDRNPLSIADTATTTATTVTAAF